MKSICRMLCAGLFFMFLVSCSAESYDPDTSTSTSETSKYLTAKYNYSADELATLDLINQYRISIGLNALEKIDYVSFVSQEHNTYMIAKQDLTHDGFVSRSNTILKTLEAEKVAENLAYNYKNPQSVVQAWLESDIHRKNIEGDYTNFGIAISVDATTGKLYYTNIFVKR